MANSKGEIWPDTAKEKLTEDLTDNNVLGGSRPDSLLTGNKQRKYTFLRFRQWLANFFAKNVDSIADLQALTGTKEGQVIKMVGYYAGVPLANMPDYVVKTGSSKTPTFGSVIVRAEGGRFEWPDQVRISFEHNGAKGDDSNDDYSRMQEAVDNHNIVDGTPEKIYLTSQPLKLKTLPGSPVFPDDYGRTLYLNKCTIKAKAGFVGDKLLEIDSPSAIVKGFGVFDSNGLVDYCIDILSTNVVIDDVRVINYEVSGIYTHTNYGSLISNIYGTGGGEFSRAVVESRDTTSCVFTNIQSFWSYGYLVYMHTSRGIVVNGGSPDKGVSGIYAEESEAALNGINFEGTKYPLYILKSFITFSGGRFHKAGGESLCRENSTDHENLDIGDAATRRAGTYIARLRSGRLNVFGATISSIDMEYYFRSDDFSGANTNILSMDSSSPLISALDNSFSLTTKVSQNTMDQQTLKHSSNYTVKGTGSVENKIELDTVLIEEGFFPSVVDVSGNDFYRMPIAGTYEVTFSCTFDASSTATYCDFSTVRDAPTVVRKERTAVSSTVKYIYNEIIKLNAGNDIRFQGVTNSIAATAVMIDPRLTIKRIGDYT